MRTTLSLVLLVVLLFGFNAESHAQERPVAESFLTSGDLSGGERALATFLKLHPEDDGTRFGLGTIQLVRTVERLVQSFHKYGLQPDFLGGQIPFARLPVPINPNPEPIGYDDLRAILQTLLNDLAQVESTLAPIKDESVKLPIRFGLVRLDLDGDGQVTAEESLWKIYAALNRQAGQNPAGVGDDAQEFPITFDRGDVAWMRGYAHLLSALVEVYLAHDAQPLFDHTAHLFFARPKTPYPILRFDARPDERFSRAWISDVIAFVHLQRYAVKEPKRLEAALAHLKSTIQLSRESWKSYLAETDNDHEWIPNPGQTTVVSGIKVTDEMVKGWHEFLDEVDKILDGKLLLPFWRKPIAPGQGLNLRKVFHEPRELDLILWVQGTSAMPYLENGSVTRPEFWSRLMRAFRGEFIGFALWFN